MSVTYRNNPLDVCHLSAGNNWRLRWTNKYGHVIFHPILHLQIWILIIQEFHKNPLWILHGMVLPGILCISRITKSNANVCVSAACEQYRFVIIIDASSSFDIPNGN